MLTRHLILIILYIYIKNQPKPYIPKGGLIYYIGNCRGTCKKHESNERKSNVICDVCGLIYSTLGECNIHASLRNKLERIAGYPFSANEADRARRLKGIYEYIPTHLADHLKSIEEQKPLNPIKQTN